MSETSAIDTLLAAIDHDKHSAEILGYTVELQPVTVLQCIRLVKRFPKLIDLFEPKTDKSGKPLPAEMQPTLMSVFLDAGAEAAGAFVACASGKEGDIAFEQSFATKPDKLTLPLFSEAVKATLGGGSLDDFFMKLMAALAAAGIIDMSSGDPVAKAA